MFTFHLEPLITLRNNALKECQAELAKAFDARRILEEDLQNTEKQLEEGITIARQLMQPGQTVNIEYLKGLRQQEEFLRAHQKGITEKMVYVDQEIEVRRNRVTEANKDLKIVEKLKEQRYEEYIEEENKAEMKTLDEIAGNKHFFYS